MYFLSNNPLRSACKRGTLLSAIAALAACSHLPQPFQPGRQLQAQEVRQLFSGKTVTSKNLSNGVVSVSRYAPNGRIQQQRQGTQRFGTWRVLPDGRICLKMERQNESCRWLRQEADGRYQKYRETHAFARPVITYVNLGPPKAPGIRPILRKNASAFADVERGHIERVQLQLNRAGFSAGPTDGLWGRRSLAAWHRFQAQHGLPRTDRLDSVTLDRLSQQPTSKLR